MSITWLFGVLAFISNSSDASNKMNAISLTAQIPNKEKYCFYEQLNASTEYTFSYNLLRGGLRDFVVNVLMHPEVEHGSVNDLNETKIPLYQKSEIGKDTFVIPMQHGIHVFCFLNNFPRPNRKVVNFSLSPSNIKPNAEYTLLDDSLQRLVDIFQSLIDHQRKQMALDDDRYRIAENLNDYVTWWSLVELCAFFVLGLGQVFMLKILCTARTNLEKKMSPDDLLSIVS
ncbi:hypothetical protein LSH36_385g01031 [Paralvinella palmiformis]|uniref:GOLD domain-containing protein n=1 Tax=Paralvinella palmiformis TaxID=53620 RepID=A0AAD9N0T5_9ANNE|nr:hypothetical protein LSH36_385g01031 [Paralvinella palmiformis]